MSLSDEMEKTNKWFDRCWKWFAIIFIVCFVTHCSISQSNQRKLDKATAERLCNSHDGVNDIGSGKSAPKELVYCNDGTVKWMD